MAADNFDGKLPPEFDELVGTKNVFFPEELSKPVIGYDFSKCGPAVDFDALLSKYSLSTGLQSTLFGRAIEEVNNMIDAKLCGTLTREDIEKQSAISNSWTPIPCTIFLSYTSNLISAGTREIIRYLAQYKMVDCIVTTAGGIEEDFIKCLAPFAVGDFELPGKELFEMHVNRNGNVLVTDGHYGLFEDWLIPILDQMLLEQKAGETWTPSKLIHRLGKEINHPDSVYYWAYKNDIPVFSPAITDGAIGDMLFFHTFKHDGKSICLDLVEDMRRICTIAWRSSKTGALLLGGGVSKHHTLNANAMRLGLDHAVFINTAQEFDGCDSGAKPDEGVSWGKIKLEVPPVKVFSEVSLVLPLLVSQTFLKRQKDFEKRRDSAIITRVLLDSF